MLSLHLKRWHFALFIYAISILIIIAVRPAIMFKQDLEMKQWGVAITDTTSIFSPAFIFPALGVVSYFLAAIFEMIFAA